MSRILANFLAAIALVLNASNITAQPTCSTIVPAGTVAGQTWSQFGSPYCVDGDIRISVLTIESGVEVYITGPYEIDVLTGLNAAGARDAPILFSAFDPANTPNLWTGIKFLNATNSSLNHVIIEHSKNAALRITNSAPELKNCEIRNNSAQGTGGGIQLDLAGVDLVLDGCKILNNTSTSHGGGIYAVLNQNASLTLRDTVVLDNYANPTLASGNFVAGGIYVNGGNVFIDNTHIVGNATYSECYQWNCTDDARGGGIYAVNGNLTVTNSHLNSNLSRARDTQIGGGEHNNSYGGAIFFSSPVGLLSVSNSVLGCNSTGIAGDGTNPISQGSGIYFSGDSVTLENVTIARSETEALYIGSGTGAIVNSILYDDTVGEKRQLVANAVEVTYSDIQDEDFAVVHPGQGNINANPIFAGVDCNAPDFTLLYPGSSLVDAGDTDSAQNDECLPPSLGSERNDIGGYGGPGACNFTDFDGDGLFNTEDNCKSAANGLLVADLGGNMQLDTDGDGIGNACDSDISGPPNDLDCQVNFIDVGVSKALFLLSDGEAGFNPDADHNGDGVINFSDLGTMKRLIFSDYSDPEQNPSGIINACVGG